MKTTSYDVGDKFKAKLGEMTAEIIGKQDKYFALHRKQGKLEDIDIFTTEDIDKCLDLVEKGLVKFNKEEHDA